jgi:hypothetical protein
MTVASGVVTTANVGVAGYSWWKRSDVGDDKLDNYKKEVGGVVKRIDDERI